jgi:hypothetical protein
MLLFTVHEMPRGMRWGDLHVLGVTPWLRLDAYADGRDQQWHVIVLTGVALTLLLLALGLIRAWVIPTVAALWIWLSIAQDIQGIDLRLGDRGPIDEAFGMTLLPAGSTIGVDRNAGNVTNFIVFGADSLTVIQVDPRDPPEGVELVYVSWLDGTDAPQGVNILGQTLGSPLVAWVHPGDLWRELYAQGLLAERRANTEVEGFPPIESDSV